jgi:hypothetical protein
MEAAAEKVFEISANLDDASGEVLGEALSRLIDEGALDAWTTPIGMKRNRPGVTLSLLCCIEDRDRLARRLIELTGTFGVRYRAWDRLVLARRHETVETKFGSIRVKVGSIEGRVVTAKPEFADARQLAEKHGVPVRCVLDAARAARMALLDTPDNP